MYRSQLDGPPVTAINFTTARARSVTLPPFALRGGSNYTFALRAAFVDSVVGTTVLFRVTTLQSPLVCIIHGGMSSIGSFDKQRSSNSL